MAQFPNQRTFRQQPEPLSEKMTTTINCSRKTVEVLDDIAHEEGVSRSAVIDWILTNFVEAYQKL